MCAASNGHVKVVRFLVDYGADKALVSTSGDHEGMTALGIAKARGHQNVVAVLKQAEDEDIVARAVEVGVGAAEA